MNDKPELAYMVETLKFVHNNEKPCRFYKFREDEVVNQSFDEGLTILKNYTNKIKNGLIVEIGVMGGAVPLFLYDILIENNNYYIGIDPFEECDNLNGYLFDYLGKNFGLELEINSYRTFLNKNHENLENIIKKYNLERIKIIKNYSANVANKFEDEQICLLHIDGSHDSISVYQDLNNFHKKIKKNGIIIIDDYDWKSVNFGVSLFLDKYSLNHKIEHKKLIIFLK